MDNNNKIILYTTEDGTRKLEVNLQDDTVWLSLDQIAELFQRNKSTISRHIKNIFEEGELAIAAETAKLKADTEYLKFQERTQHELTPVEIQFRESFEEVQKRIK